MSAINTIRVICLKSETGKWFRAYEIGGDLDMIKPEHRTAVAMLDAAGAGANLYKPVHVAGVGSLTRTLNYARHYMYYSFYHLETSCLQTA